MKDCICTDLLRRVLSRDVQPALGCTEPAAVALACSHAAATIHPVGASYRQIEQLTVLVSPGVLKNGCGVGIPNTSGQRGLPIAAALGAICGQPQAGLQVLSTADPLALDMATRLIQSGRVTVISSQDTPSFFIKSDVAVAGQTGSATISGSHTNLAALSRNGSALPTPSSGELSSEDGQLNRILSRLTVSDLVDLAELANEGDVREALHGAEMNLLVAQQGTDLDLVGAKLRRLIREGVLTRDVINEVRATAACAVDARMSGVNLPVMSSGGSGNQGIIAILVPYLFGKSLKVAESTIGRAIILSHLLNSYCKCFTGKIGYMCGCSIAAGIGAAAGVVYLSKGTVEHICNAINCVIGEIAGVICDGAKSTCALKVANSVEASIRCAYLALSGFSVGRHDGIIGRTAEASIINLGKVSATGDRTVNGTILEIITRKEAPV